MSNRHDLSSSKLLDVGKGYQSFPFYLQRGCSCLYRQIILIVWVQVFLTNMGQLPMRSTPLKLEEMLMGCVQLIAIHNSDQLEWACSKTCSQCFSETQDSNK